MLNDSPRVMVLLIRAMALARADRATARSEENLPFHWKQWKLQPGLTTLIMVAEVSLVDNSHHAPSSWLQCSGKRAERGMCTALRSFVHCMPDSQCA